MSYQATFTHLIHNRNKMRFNFTLAFYFLFFITSTFGQNKPNIVIFFADDLRGDAVGYSGNNEVLTPNIDLLAERGIVFNRHYVSSPICMQSRASIMTGLYEYKHGCGFRHGGLKKELWENSYPVQLRKGGYNTGFGGKFGFAVRDTLDDLADYSHKTDADLPIEDFTDWGGWVNQGKYETYKNDHLAKYADEFPHVTRALGAYGRDFIAKYADEAEPFCLTIHFKAPHLPDTPDPAYDSIFEGKVFSYPENYGEEGASHLSPQALAGRQFKQFYDRWDTTYHEQLRKYYQLIYGMDVAIGMILDELENQGVADSTIIIFTSDNGYFHGSHNLHGKTMAYEEASRVPLVIYDPRNDNMNQGIQINNLTSIVDVTATILDFAEVSPTYSIDGLSITPVLHDSSQKIRSHIPLLQCFPDTPPNEALSVVTQDYKYIYWGFSSADTLYPYKYYDQNPAIYDSPAMVFEPQEELYNLLVDELEMNNLVFDSSLALVNMRSIYDNYLEDWKNNGAKYNGYDYYEGAFIRMIDTIYTPIDTNQTGTNSINNILQNIEEIRIYPTIVRDEIIVDGKDIVEVNIYSIVGRKILSYREEINELNVSDIIPGSYFVEVYSREGYRKTFKIVKVE